MKNIYNPLTFNLHIYCGLNIFICPLKIYRLCLFFFFQGCLLNLLELLFVILEVDIKRVLKLIFNNHT